MPRLVRGLAAMLLTPALGFAAAPEAGPPSGPSSSPPSAAAPAAPAALLAAAPVIPPAPVCDPCSSALATLCEPAGCGCRSVGRGWVQADLLLWFADGDRLPPLVAAAPGGTPRPIAGVLGQPGTSLLLGNTDTDYGLLPGFRIRAGTWFDDAGTRGLEASYFFLSRGGDPYRFGSAGSPVVTRPFVNAASGLADAELVAFPGVLAGSVAVDNTLVFTGGDINVRRNLRSDDGGRLDLLAGYRVLYLAERLSVTESLVNLTTNRGVDPGTAITVRDRFRTANTFHGGQLGAAWERGAGRWVVDARALVALGVVHKESVVTGSTTFAPPGGPATTGVGGLLAQRSNIGRDTDDDFAVVPEVAVNVGYRVTDSLRLTVGYTFLYLSDAARPGGLVDLAVDPRQLPPTQAAATRPAVQNRDRDFWAQGINLGVNWRY